MLHYNEWVFPGLQFKISHQITVTETFMLSVKIYLFPNDVSINSFRMSVRNIQKKKKDSMNLVKRENSRKKNDKLIFQTVEAFVFYGLSLDPTQIKLHHQDSSS